MAFLSNMLGDMFGGTDFSSLYGNMATQQQQPQPYSGQSPWSNFSNFGLGSMWGGGSGQHPGLGSWGSPSYSQYEAPSSESVQAFGESQQQMQQQQMEQQRQQAEQQRQQGIEQQRYQNQQMQQQPQRQRGHWAAQRDARDWEGRTMQQEMDRIRQQSQQHFQQAAGGVPSPPSGAFMPQQMDRASMLNMIQGLF